MISGSGGATPSQISSDESEDSEESFNEMESQSPPRSVQGKQSRRKKIRFTSYQTRYISDLRREFNRADAYKEGRLTYSQWINSNIRQFIRDGSISDEEYSLYFARVDANSDNYVSWEELVQYLMKEIAQAELHIDDQSLNFIQKTSNVIPSRQNMHRDMIKQISISDTTNEYVTLSNDSVRFWAIYDLQFHRAITDPGLFASMCVFDRYCKIAVATTSRRLLLFDTESLEQLECEINASPSSQIIKKMTTRDARATLSKLKSKKMTLYNLPTAMIIGEYTPSVVLNTYFYIADDQGVIQAFLLTAPQRRQSTDYRMKRVGRYTMHSASITQLSLISTYECYASSSYDATVKFWTFDPKTSIFTVLRQLNDYGPVTSFNFSNKQKLIITCSISRDAYVWSITPQRRVFKLGGHYNLVQAITDFVTTTNEKYLLTMTTRKEFRLWDAVNYRMAREWNDPSLQRPENFYSTAFYDARRHALITASSIPTRWSENISLLESFLEKKTHKHAIIGCHYSKVFKSIVTVDCICNFMVWSLKDGVRTSNKQTDWQPGSSDISASVLDVSGRRLVTASFDNQVFLWNFNSGSVINELEATEGTALISTISYFKIGAREYLARGGWDKMITLFAEVEKGSYILYRQFKGHTNDISSIVGFSGGLISGSTNGEILLWILDTNMPQASYSLDEMSAVECMIVVDNYLLVGDSIGFLHVFSLPKLQCLVSQKAHQIIVNYSLTSMDANEEYLYTADTFGYVKKWKMSYDQMLQFELEEIDIFRCHNDDIMSINLVMGGKFIVTCGIDMCVRIFEAENFEYVGLFNEESKPWNLEKKETWISKPPAVVELKHFNTKLSELSNTASNLMRSFNSSIASFRNLNINLKNSRQEFQLETIQPQQEVITEDEEEQTFNLTEAQQVVDYLLERPKPVPIFEVKEKVKEPQIVIPPRRLQLASRPVDLIERFDIIYSSDKKDRPKTAQCQTNEHIVRLPIKTPKHATMTIQQRIRTYQKNNSNSYK